MPSTNSRVVSEVLPSSTVMTPSLPTLSMASAMIRPMASSLLAEIDATCRISSFLVSFLEIESSCSTTAATALSMPRLTAKGECLGVGLAVGGRSAPAPGGQQPFLPDAQQFVVGDNPGLVLAAPPALLLSSAAP